MKMYVLWIGLLMLMGCSEPAEQAFAKADVTQKIEQHYQTFLKYHGELTGVPTFILNGKYVAKFTNEMDIDEMIALLEWLANKS